MQGHKCHFWFDQDIKLLFIYLKNTYDFKEKYGTDYFLCCPGQEVMLFCDVI